MNAVVFVIIVFIGLVAMLSLRAEILEHRKERTTMSSEAYKKRLKYSRPGPSPDVWVGAIVFLLLLIGFSLIYLFFKVMIHPGITIPISVAGGIAAYYGTIGFIEKNAPRGRYMAKCPPNKEIGREVWGSMVNTIVNPTPDMLQKVELMALRSHAPCIIMRPGSDGFAFLGPSDEKYSITVRWKSLTEMESGDRDKLAIYSLFLGIRNWKIDDVPHVLSVDGITTIGKWVILYWPEDLLKPLYNVPHLQDTVVPIIAEAWRRVIGRLNYSASIADILERSRLDLRGVQDQGASGEKFGELIKKLRIEMIERIREEFNFELGLMIKKASEGAVPEKTVKAFPVCADDFKNESAKDPDINALFPEVYPEICEGNCLQVSTPAWSICKKAGIGFEVLVTDIEDEGGKVTGAIKDIVLMYAERQKEIIEAEMKRLVKIAEARGKRAATVLEISSFDAEVEGLIDPDKYAPPEKAIEHWKYVRTLEAVPDLPDDTRLVLTGKDYSLGGVMSALAAVVATVEPSGSKAPATEKKTKGPRRETKGKEKPPEVSRPEGGGEVESS